MSIWTQTLDIAWRPELRFYEHGASVLREIQEDSSLSAFRLSDDEAGAQLGDEYHEIDFSARGLTASLLRPDADMDRVLMGMSIVLKRLQPSRFEAPSIRFMHVRALAKGYDEARQEAIRSLFGSVEFGPAVVGDFANLLDGVTTEPPGSIHVEYGIVSADELPMRLTGLLGQVSPRLPRAAERSVPLPRDAEDFPAVALFADMAFQLLDRIPDEDPLAKVTDMWRTCRKTSSQVAETLSSNLFGSGSEQVAR